MAVIKFDSEKTDALIRDLNRISSELDSNFIKVYNIVHGKEINLTDVKLKVYSYVDKVIDIVQDDGTVVQETIKEKVLKNDFVANARMYNKHIRNMYNRSKTAKLNAVKSIESVVNSLNKIKYLISEYESETRLNMSSHLEDVGQFNFNFLAAYGPMGKTQNYSESFGTVVADDAYTSLHLGILGQRPTSINLKKLEVFDGMLEIAKDNGLSYQEKFKKVQNLLVDNVLEINPENMRTRTKEALDSMINIAKSVDTIINDNLKIESLVKFGVPVIEDYDGSLAVDIKKVDDALQNVVTFGSTVLGTEKAFNDCINIDFNGDGKNETEISGIDDVLGKIINKDEHQILESQLGIDSDVTLEIKTDVQPPLSSVEQVASNQLENQLNDDVISTVDITNDVSNFTSNDNPSGFIQNTDMSEDFSVNNDIDISNDKQINEIPIKQDVIKESQQQVDSNKLDISEKNEVVKNENIEDVSINEDIKQSSEALDIDNDIQSIKIEKDYKDIEVSESTELENINEDIEEKGAGVLAGAAGIGVLSKMNITPNVDVPQINGMAAGEILGINTTGDSTAMGMAFGNTTNSSVSNGNVNPTPLSNSSVGGESTSDRGIVSKDNSISKESTSPSSGKGGSTLEHKEEQQENNSYVKNKKDGNEIIVKKGLLGDASIAELDAKDKKEIKIATGVTTVSVILSGLLALLNIFPFLMIIIAFIFVGIYACYRVKKEKDKMKRKNTLTESSTQQEENSSVMIESIQNVSDTEKAISEFVAEETANKENQESTFVITGKNSDEFSEQPYEPLRDGVSEMCISFKDSKK